jgi:hypothetical protein
MRFLSLVYILIALVSREIIVSVIAFLRTALTLPSHLHSGLSLGLYTKFFDDFLSF